MSDMPDPLEAEMASLQPHEPSAALRRRVADRLSERRRGPWRRVLAGSMAAACVVVAFVYWHRTQPVPPGPIPPLPPQTVIADTGPTLLAYERALARSPEELDALLQAEVISPRSASDETMPLGALTHSETALHTLLGDD